MTSFLARFFQYLYPKSQIMKKALFLSFLFISLGLVAQEEEKAGPPPRIAIKIPLGESLLAEGISMEFMEVMEDSRCPKDVVCVWAGQAKVKLVVSQNGTSESSDVKEIIVGKQGVNTIAQQDGFAYKAIGLSPYPTTQNTGKRNYVLLVVKEKVAD